MTIQAPFPWFGGKRRAAPQIWARLGDPPNYVEPFAGSLAVLLERPANHHRKTETVNDLDGYIANFWRAVASAPESVAHHADWPIIEADLHARHAWLVSQRGTLLARLEGDPYWFDPRIAGWWVAGVCAWIGSGYCSGDGPWTVKDGLLTRESGDAGRGINRKLPHISHGERCIQRRDANITEWLNALATRLRRVRITNGDWTRVTTESVTTKHGTTGILLDPPYSDDTPQTRVYATDHPTVANDVHQWCLDNGHNPQLRIALCGYASERHDTLTDNGWTRQTLKAGKGYGGGRGGVGETNRHLERIWFSPACIPEDNGLFDIIDHNGGAA